MTKEDRTMTAMTTMFHPIAPTEGYVYLIAHHERRRVKIGHSHNPLRRLKQVQNGCPDCLSLVDYVPGGRALETAFHRQFADRRVMGEWFRDDDHLITQSFTRMAYSERMADVAA